VVQTRFPASVLTLLRRLSLGDELGQVIVDGRRALEDDVPQPDGNIEHPVFLGRGWTTGSADEAAMKFREMAGGWSKSDSATDYRRGPLGAASRRTLVWSVDPLPEEVKPTLIDDSGARVHVVELEPVAELVGVQRQAVVAARASSPDPAHPLFLDRSVILP